MNTYLVPNGQGVVREIDPTWPPGFYLALTILGRLNTAMAEIPLCGMCILFGWTEEDGVEALVKELGLPRERAKFMIELLAQSGHIEEVSDAEITELISL